MLALKLSNSLVTSNNPSGSWTPSDETNLISWQQNKIGITLNGSDVSQWADQSGNSHNFSNLTATEQPSYDASTGALTFDSSDSNNLQTIVQMSFAANFTIGIKIEIDGVGGIIFADNTIANEFLKVFSTNTLRFKIDGTVKDLSLDSGAWGDGYLVISRTSNVLKLYWNGVLQADTETLAGTVDIDALGIRFGALNPFNGKIYEVQIYDESSDELAVNVNNYLANI